MISFINHRQDAIINAFTDLVATIIGINYIILYQSIMILMIGIQCRLPETLYHLNFHYPYGQLFEHKMRYVFDYAFIYII